MNAAPSVGDGTLLSKSAAKRHHGFFVQEAHAAKAARGKKCRYFLDTVVTDLFLDYFRENCLRATAAPFRIITSHIRVEKIKQTQSMMVDDIKKCMCGS